jgi:xanthine dehydrogenase accessory factor
MQREVRPAGSVSLSPAGISTLDLRKIQESAAAYRDDIIPDLARWTGQGERCALITLIGVDGNAPRQAGAQMAVSETGEWAGYISGGCLEQAIVLEALGAIEQGKPRLLRYGKGSPYFDIRLPCGSGLDVFIQPFHEPSIAGEMQELLSRRQPFALRIEFLTGSAALWVTKGESISSQPERDERGFTLYYPPSVRFLVLGSSPIAVKLAELAACTGFETTFHASDFESLPIFPGQVAVHPLLPGAQFEMDRWTAAILAFHDHDQELQFLPQLLEGPCFFLAAIGSRNAHAARKLALAEAGFAEADIGRLRSPAGLVPGLKSAPLVAVSILAQAIAAAQEQRIIP